jgi:hypothetical protein
VHYLLADQLGSTSTILSATGTVEESAKYYPYGSLRSGSISLTDEQLTGQQDDPGYWADIFGLYDCGAWFYGRHYGKMVVACRAV